MTYNPEGAIETQVLPADAIMDGVIIDIKDGKLQDFVANMEGWKSKPEQTAIEATVEVKVQNNVVRVCQIFTYFTEEGKTAYGKRSNLGKFKCKYTKLPSIGMLVKVYTDGDGYGKIKLD